MHSPFDSIYQNHHAIYGDQPSPFLVHYLNKYRVPACGHGLDLGCGQGRNTLYLARQGYAMCGVDASAVAIANLARRADQQRLPVVAQIADLRTLYITPNKYQLIVANTALDHLPADAGAQLAEQMQKHLAPDAYLFVSVFMVNDPGCLGHESAASETARQVLHYYEPDELRQQFSGLTILAYHEEYALDTGHGSAHYHGIARLFARRAGI